MSKVRFGIVGVGNQGTYYANLLKDGKIENGVLTCLCDNNPAKLNIAKEKFSMIDGCEFYDNYLAMLEANKCDAILVETPHYSHPEIAISF